MPLYRLERINPDDGNILLRFFDCIWCGIKYRLRGNSSENLTNSPWIDGSVEKYPANFVKDVSTFLQVCVCVCVSICLIIISRISIAAETLRSPHNILDPIHTNRLKLDIPSIATEYKCIWF